MSLEITWKETMDFVKSTATAQKLEKLKRMFNSNSK